MVFKLSNASLVGYTGFVGSNLMSQFRFDHCYNSSNIEDAFGVGHSLVVYSGVRAEKYLATHCPEEDKQHVEGAMSNIGRMNPSKLVLISTVDIYKTPVDVDEDTVVNTNDLHPYGLHRYHLETWVQENIPDYLIVRLPGLFGRNLKKNFIFDMIHLIPTMLKGSALETCRTCIQDIDQYYEDQGNGFWKLRTLTNQDKERLRGLFSVSKFNALNFTDSRSVYQFYNLEYLWGHIEKAMEAGISLLNLATAPISASELYRYVRSHEFNNPILPEPIRYNMLTKYAHVFGGKDGYILDKQTIMNDIKRFVRESSMR